MIDLSSIKEVFPELYEVKLFLACWVEEGQDFFFG